MPQSNVFSGPFSLTSQGVTDALGYTPVNRAGDTMLGDLKFTDATYDIGKAGATRPRDLFYSRTGQGGTLALGGATIGSHALAVTGTMSLSGTLTAAAATFSSTATIANNVALRWGDAGAVARDVIVLNSGGGLSITNNNGGTGGPIQFITGATEIFRVDGTNGLYIASGQKLTLGNAYAAGATSPTGSLTLYDSAGVAYKVPAQAA